VNVAVYFAQILKIFARIMANFSVLGCDRIPMPYAYGLEHLPTFLLITYKVRKKKNKNEDR